MGNSMVSLAVFDGFVGQLFEYWPLTFLVVVSIVYITIAVGSDIIYRKRHRLPVDAQARVEIEVDPMLIARNRVRTGLYLVRMGVAAVVVLSVAVAYLAHYPLSIGDQYGLTQEANPSTAAGARVGLIAAGIAALAAIFVRAAPMPLIGLAVAAMLVFVFAPPAFNGDARWIGIMVTITAAPSVLVAIGVVKAYRNLEAATRPREQPSEATPMQVR